MNRLRDAQSLPCTNIFQNISKAQKNSLLSKIFPKSTGNLKTQDSVPREDDQSVNNEYTEDLNEASNLINENIQVPKERWIALALFCVLTFSQCCIWNTWGPITTPTMIAFTTWRKYHIALLSDWGCITYLTFCLPCCWFLHRKGLLEPIRTAAVLTVLAAFVRCFSCDDTIFTITAHFGAILNGLSGVIIGPATALVSAVWFPRGERTTATGISSACNQLGMAASYLIGPAVVDTMISSNNTALHGNTNRNVEISSREKRYDFHSLDRTDARSSSNDEHIREILRVQIMSLMRIGKTNVNRSIAMDNDLLFLVEFVIQSLIVVGILSFFPKQPNYSIDSTEKSSRFGLVESIVSLLKKKNMWQLCLAAAFSQGVTGPWLSMITITFDSMVTQEEADKLAFWTIIFSSVISLVASRVADIFQGHLRIGLYTLLMISVVMFLWVLLLENRVLIFRKEELYAAVILGISASWSTPALFLELASEIAFPVSEAIVGGYMIFLANLIGTLFYFSYFIPGIGDRWSTYCVFGNLSTATILVIYLKEEYNRTKFEQVY